MSIIKNRQGRFYVYALLRPDGSPFYVGCGKVQSRGFQRIAFHEREARDLNIRTHKANTIRKILVDGGVVGYRIESWHASECAMFAAERRLIAKVGRADEGRGPLTNWSAGGDGLVSRSVAVVAKASATMKTLVDDEWRRRSSVRTKAHWESAEGRAKRLNANSRPETKEQQRAAGRAIAASPANDKRKKTMRSTWCDPEYRQRQRAAHRAALAAPEYKKRKSEESKKRWSDSSYKERLREIHRRRWAMIRQRSM